MASTISLVDRAAAAVVFTLASTDGKQSKFVSLTKSDANNSISVTFVQDIPKFGTTASHRVTAKSKTEVLNSTTNVVSSTSFSILGSLRPGATQAEIEDSWAYAKSAMDAKLAELRQNILPQ